MRIPGPYLPVTPAQLMRPGIGQNVSCTLGDCLTSRPEGHSWPRELWFSIYSCPSPSPSPMHVIVHDVHCTGYCACPGSSVSPHTAGAPQGAVSPPHTAGAPQGVVSPPTLLVPPRGWCLPPHCWCPPGGGVSPHTAGAPWERCLLLYCWCPPESSVSPHTAGAPQGTAGGAWCGLTFRW